MFNHDTGEKAEVEFKIRGWSAKNKEAVHCVIKDKKGVAKYELSGKYTQSLVLKNLETEETREIWKAAEYPDNHMMMYGFNAFTLQLNIATDKLKDKLPPTDSRHRKDVKEWEHGRMQESTDEKNRLENNQR